MICQSFYYFDIIFLLNRKKNDLLMILKLKQAKRQKENDKKWNKIYFFGACNLISLAILFFIFYFTYPARITIILLIILLILSIIIGFLVFIIFTRIFHFLN